MMKKKKMIAIILSVAVFLSAVACIVFLPQDKGFSIVEQQQIDFGDILLQVSEQGVVVSSLAQEQPQVQENITQLARFFQNNPPAEDYMLTLLAQEEQPLAMGYTTAICTDSSSAFSVSVESGLTLMTVVCSDGVRNEYGALEYDIYTYGFWMNAASNDKTASPAPCSDHVSQYLGFAGLCGLEETLEAYYADGTVGVEGDEFWHSGSYSWSIWDHKNNGLQSFVYHTRAEARPGEEPTGEEHYIYSTYMHTWSRRSYDAYRWERIIDEETETYRIVPGNDKAWVLHNRVKFTF